MKKPYIGVTGFMSATEVAEVSNFYRECWKEAGRKPTHDLMIGVLASAKTLTGYPNKWPLRYPKTYALSAITVGIDVRYEATMLLHYAPTMPVIVADLSYAWGHVSDHFDGLQINAPWPDPAAIVELRRRERRARIVLQLGPVALGSGPFGGIVDRLQNDYGDAIDDVLVDVSGGRGIEVPSENEVQIRMLVDELRAAERWTIGIAGGLCAETLGDWHGRLLRSGGSIDAEGKLRDGAPEGGNLDLEKVRAYLRKAVQMAAEAA